jgi:hypothetical protein
LRLICSLEQNPAPQVEQHPLATDCLARARGMVAEGFTKRVFRNNGVMAGRSWLSLLAPLENGVISSESATAKWKRFRRRKGLGRDF